MKKTLLMGTTAATAAAFALFMTLPSAGQDGPPAGAPGGGAPGAAKGGPGGGGARGGGGRGGGAAVPAGPMPRTPDGHPDMSGFWNLPERAGATGIEGPDPNAPAAPAGGG